MDWQTLDLKKTVNLPQTKFAMKANLSQAEPKTLERWAAADLYNQIRTARAGRPRYILHDGPPYANGNIHLGHAFNKLLKDFIVKSKTMSGFDAPYIPGWDCHGLPIEIKVDGELGSKKAKMTPVEIRQACRKYAAKYVELQKKDFQRLGVFGRWDDPYMTMSAEYEAVIAGAFVDFVEQGYVFKGLKPVNWCINCRTALAEAEIEYENHSSPSIWVRFALTSDAAAIDPALAGQRVFGLIWTTTPWTIPANLAIAYHPKFEYLAARVGEDVYIVAAELLAVTAAKCGWETPEVIARFAGAKLEGAVFRHPFLERDSRGILGDHVTLEQGTGAVHTAPGHGMDDYIVSKKYGIDAYCPVDGAGRMFQAEGAAGELPAELLGKTVWQANPVVIEILTARGALVGQEKIEHSYPHCWRCHKPTIFRATEQWFIGMDRNTLRERALDAIKKIKWMPAWGEERISNMIAARPDWNISRQRIWGVPIVAFYCSGCSEPLLDVKILRGVVERFKTETADAWYAHEASELIPAGTSCGKCGGAEFTKEKDILDVWFDSGASHLAVLTAANDHPWPADMYLEGGDQYRGWFHSSLLIGVGLRGAAPYRECLTSGWTLDAQGRAMSKSLGNTIEPDHIIKQYGAEILRLWVGSVEYWEDVRLSESILVQLAEAYRKLRNTFRYLLGNLHDFDPAVDTVPADELYLLDQWMLARTADLVKRCRTAYDEYAFHRVYRALYDFATVELSAVYFDVLKDRLYTTAPKSFARRSAQTALLRLNDALVRLVAPVLAFTAEEVWLEMKRPGSIHTEEFPAPEDLTAGFSDAARERIADFERLMDVRVSVMKSLEDARQAKAIGAGLEAKVTLAADGSTLPLLETYAAELAPLFVVSEVIVRNGAAALEVAVDRADGAKCDRCWKYRTDLGTNPQLPTVCADCTRALEETYGS